MSGYTAIAGDDGGQLLGEDGAALISDGSFVPPITTPTVKPASVASMRVYGRVPTSSLPGLVWGGPGVLGGTPQILGSPLTPGVLGGPTNPYTWVEVSTDANGFDDNPEITWLIQCLKLGLNESPFWADWGIPAQQSIMTQVAPDYYVTLMQSRFAQYFASLTIVKTSDNPPTYNVNLITQQGVQRALSIPT